MSHVLVFLTIRGLDRLRSLILDDFGFGRLLGWISASGIPPAVFGPDRLRSLIFNDFGSGRLLGWISASGIPPAELGPDHLRSLEQDAGEHVAAHLGKFVS